MMMMEAKLVIGEASKSDTLNHLPLAAAFGHQLRIIEIIDQHCPPHATHALTHGQCIFAMMLSILAGRYPLYEVGNWLGDVARDVLFGQELAAEHFHDTRLATALDAIYQAGLLQIFSDLVLHAIDYYQIQTQRLHGDTTSVSVYGNYPQADPEVLQLLHGHSKDHRPDLKQLIFGLVVSGDGGIPLLGQLHNGNQSDHVTNRWQLNQLRQIVPDLAGTTLVYDSKFFDARTLGLAYTQGVHWISLVPGNNHQRKEMVGRVLAEKQPLVELRRRPGRRKDDAEEVFQGASVVDQVEIELPGADSGPPVRQPMAVRYLVVHSSQLARQQARTLARRIIEEEEQLGRALARLGKRRFACQEDALGEAAKWNKINSPDYHQVSFVTEPTTRRVPRDKQGRPSKGEEPKWVQEWLLQGQLELVPGALQEEEERLGYFVLATNHLDPSQVSDLEVLEWYKKQDQVEGGFAWLKGPAAFAPIFLKKPQRILALGMVFLMALMVYTLLERQVRRALVQREEELPGNNNVLTQKPTAAVLFKHFAGIRRVWRESGGVSRPVIEGFTQLHQRILALLGLNTRVFTLSTKILAPPACGSEMWARPQHSPTFFNPTRAISYISLSLEALATRR